MAFWKLAYNQKWVTSEQLRLAVKTETNPFGEILLKSTKKLQSKNFKTQSIN